MLHAVLLDAQYATLRLTVWRYEPGPPTPALGRSGEIGGDVASILQQRIMQIYNSTGMAFERFHSSDAEGPIHL
jgi:hypothetical protein